MKLTSFIVIKERTFQKLICLAYVGAITITAGIVIATPYIYNKIKGGKKTNNSQK